MKDVTNKDEPSSGVFSADKIVPAFSNTVNENRSLDTAEIDTTVDADVGKVTAATYELRLLLHMLACSFKTVYSREFSNLRILVSLLKLSPII